MRTDEYTIEHLKRIFQFYEQILGPSRVMRLDPQTVLSDIMADEVRDGYRVGSKWEEHSKLTFKTLYPSYDCVPKFNPNFDINERDTSSHKLAEKSGELFEKSALEYLASCNKEID